MNFKPLILPLLLAATLSPIYVIPQAGEIAQSAVNMTLPAVSGAWHFKHIPPSEAEINTLAKDTEFAKAICLCPRQGEYSAEGESIPDRADLSVVLSGHDMNNSIHRPERCMPAQGHNILATENVTLTLANGRAITVRRLRSIQTLTNAKDRKEDLHYDCVTYYFFVGHDRIEHDHLQRTLSDISDRLLRGIDQRWAYVSISMWFGKMPWIEKPVTEQEADAKLRNLLSGFAEEQIDWGRVTK
ncbi:MAG: exosortase-associated EpsI family protein [Verrucomicrobia bacterium]|nr:exosortase-associated EpsI family protein [Verrucomicrobiota bacterium]